MTDARMQHFAALDQTQQKQAVARLAALGMSDHGIAHATRLSVEFVRHLLAERMEGNSDETDGGPSPLQPVFEKASEISYLQFLPDNEEF